MVLVLVVGAVVGLEAGAEVKDDDKGLRALNNKTNTDS